jgi:hypothetical protein
VTVASFQDEAALDAFIENEAAGIESTTDPEPLGADGHYLCPHYSTWGEQVIVGPYLCRWDGTEYRAVWGFTNDAYNGAPGGNEALRGEVFAVIASTADRIALDEWWTAVPV